MHSQTEERNEKSFCLWDRTWTFQEAEPGRVEVFENGKPISTLLRGPGSRWLLVQNTFARVIEAVDEARQRGLLPE